MWKLFKNLVILFVIGFAIFFYRAPLKTMWSQVIGHYLPCTEPISYSVASFDPRFGISEEYFLSALRDAEAMWEGPMGMELFQYTEYGVLDINLIYDTRQESTVKLRELGISVQNTRASYDELRTRYDSISRNYESGKTAFQTRVAAFEKRKDAYEAEVSRVNRRGGATPNELNRLNAEKAYLNSEVTYLENEEDRLNRLVVEVNALARSLNQLAAILNVNVDKFNTIGGALEGEFEEGTYRSSAGAQHIDIYQFDNRTKLVRVLAHELGHALGLDHSDDEKAIMYRLNNGFNETLNASDIAMLKTHCGIE